ncbi:hypothetical protein [Neobacillus citreus]|uniref:hypothetical protein n=1 Tax=Neobacillus citreus TaxID=2833578 RepID=UPI001F13AFF1|nr:hypothetical protein [Neobacillus citreus]
MNQPIETSYLLKTEKEPKNNKRKEEPLELDHSYVSNHVPQEFVQLVSYFYSDAKTIEEFWHMTQIAAYKYNSENETDQMQKIAIEAFKQLIRKLKSTKAVRNPIAYFYGVLQNKFMRRFYDELDGEYGVLPGSMANDSWIHSMFMAYYEDKL